MPQTKNDHQGDTPSSSDNRHGASPAEMETIQDFSKSLADNPASPPLVAQAVDLVRAFLNNAANPVSPDQIPVMLEQVHKSLSSIAQRERGQKAEDGESQSASERRRGSDRRTLAQPIVTEEYIQCQECGRKMKTLKRHLSSVHNMTAEQYRAKYSLPADHPMVAGEYSRQRSETAKRIGLGNLPKTPGGAVKKSKKPRSP